MRPLSRSRLLLAAFFLVQLAFGLAGPLRGRTTDAEAYRRAGARLAGSGSPYGDASLPFLYPPALAVAFVPVSSLPPRAVAIGWGVVSAAVLAAAVALLASGDARTLALALVWAPFAATQWNGQANALVLLFLVLGRRALRDTRALPAGGWLGAALAVKPLALAAVASLATRRRGRSAALAAAVLVASLLLVVPFGGSPIEAGERAVQALTASWPETWGANVSLGGTLDRWFGPGHAGARHTALRALPILAALVAVARRLGPLATFDAVLAATLLAAPASWLHHAAVLFPAVPALALPVAALAAALLAFAAAWGTLGTWAPVCGTAALAIVMAARLASAPGTDRP